MKPKPRESGQDALLRPRLATMIELRRELVISSRRNGPGSFRRRRAGRCRSARVVAGLLCLQHAYGRSDEAVLARWVETPDVQRLCGETFVQHLR